LHLHEILLINLGGEHRGGMFDEPGPIHLDRAPNVVGSIPTPSNNTEAVKTAFWAGLPE
jgi:hypothetical protein